MRKRLSGLLLCCALLFLCGCADKVQNEPKQESPAAENDGFVEEIQKRGYLLAGCKTDVPDLSFYDEETDTWSGLEVELAYQTAARLFDVSVSEAKERGLVRFTGVTVADREEKLENKEVDCLLATYTITPERKQRFAFSDSYYTDYIGLMVKTSGEDPNALGTSDIRSIADLDGKKIGVAKNATTRKAFLSYIETMNNIQTAPIFLEYPSYQAIFSALKNGSVDVMAVDVSILNGYVDRKTRILNDRFGGQRYGVAVRKENTGLLAYVNEALTPGEDTQPEQTKTKQTEAFDDTQTAQLLKLLKEIPQEDYKAALSYDENRSEKPSDSHLVLLNENKTAGVRLYGLESNAYGCRGLAAEHEGVWSFFDDEWDSWRFKPRLYAGDFNNDSRQELAMISGGGYGTGVAIDRLGIFTMEEDGTMQYYPMDTLSFQWLEEQLGPYIRFDKRQGKIYIEKDGQVYQEIDLTTSAEYPDDPEDISIIYTTQISFEVQKNKIKMLVDVLGSTNNSFCYMDGVENTLVSFDVEFQDGGYKFQPSQPAEGH